MKRKRLKIPALCQHKATGQGRVRINGKDYYVGKFDSLEAQERYEKLIGEYLTLGAVQEQPESNDGILLGILVARYTAFADGYYRKNGEATSEASCISNALASLAPYSETPAKEFGPQRLKAVRDRLVKAGVSRTTINAHLSRIRRLFKWGVSEELVPASVLLALGSVPGLRKGRTEAREPESVKPVSDASIKAISLLVAPQVRDMIQLQLLSGCRPGEIVQLRPIDLNREGETWEYLPTDHKMQHLGRERRVFFGPRAQAILKNYLNRSPQSPCFSPKEAEQFRHVQQRASRKTSVQPSQQHRKAKTREREPADQYTSASYRRAVARACETAEIEVWSPNQLRHSRATFLRKEFGIETARTVLGHSSVGTTEIYAETDFAKARQVMLEVG